MTASAEDSVKCRCGRSTYAVPGYEDARTCSFCGYLTTYCRCKSAASRPNRMRFEGRSAGMARALLGGAAASFAGTTLVVAVIASPLVALLGMGVPVSISLAFMVQWFRDGARLPGQARAGPTRSHAAPFARR